MSQEISSTKLTEQDFELMSQANKEFSKQRYSNCLQTLQQLEESMGKNAKLTHNKAVVEFYQSECKDYDKFLSFLETDISEYVEANTELSQQEGKRYIAPSYFNKAVVLLHQRKPFGALQTIMPLMEKLDAFDESLTIRAGILSLYLLLKTNQYKRAATFLQHLQSHLGIEVTALIATPVPTEGSVSAEKVLQIDNSKRMLKLLAILTNLLNGIDTAIPDDGTIEMTFVKAHQFYLGKDFQMAAKQFLKKFSEPPFSVERNGEDQDTILANNMGVIHLRVKHFAIGLNFFQHAVTFDNKITENGKEIPLQSIGASKLPEILYNMGIALLHLQRPKEALECFTIPLEVYHKNPRLWLRAGEACIMAYEQNLKENEKKHIVSAVIGSGVHRKYVLEPNPIVKRPNFDYVKEPTPTLEFGMYCLSNATILIEEFKEKYFEKFGEESSSNKRPEWIDSTEVNYFNPSPPITKESMERLIIAAYAGYSYACVRLGEYFIGLEYGKKLLELENVPQSHAMLGRLYCAEALIMLNRHQEASKHLELAFLEGLNPQDFETKDWLINSVEAAQSLLRYNYAVTLVLKGDLDEARKELSMCTHPLVFTKFKMLKMYIELSSGNVDNCKIMVRIDTPHFR